MNDPLQGFFSSPPDESNELQNGVIHSILKQVEGAFESCQQNTQTPFHIIHRIGDIPFRLNFWGSSLIPRITPAFRHLLEENTAEPGLSIHLWDDTATEISFPRVKNEFRERSTRGESWAAATDRYDIFFQPSIGILNLLDKQTNQAYFWARNSSGIPYYESGAPLRRILFWWMGSHGFHLLHGGAVGTDEGGVLLAGKGGSGKSTTALTCLRAGLYYAGDDYCMVSTQPAPHVHSIYCSGKLNSEDIGRFPEFNPALSNQEHLDEEKALYFFFDHFPGQIVKDLPLCALLIPEITNQENATLEKVSAAATYLALAPSTILQNQDKKRPLHPFLGGLVKQVPGYRLKLGRNMKQTPMVIRDLITDLHSF